MVGKYVKQRRKTVGTRGNFGKEQGPAQGSRPSIMGSQVIIIIITIFVIIIIIIIIIFVYFHHSQISLNYR